jgi:hypothetical protein
VNLWQFLDRNMDALIFFGLLVGVPGLLALALVVSAWRGSCP